MHAWVDAWHSALYGPAGFYRDARGPAGHFATSTHGPSGRLFARAVATLALARGCTQILDVGAGRGELLRELAALIAAGDAELTLMGTDVVPRPGDLPGSVGWVQSAGGADLPDLGPLENTLVVANEWLDVIACPIAAVDRTGVLREVLVAPDGTEGWGDPAGTAATIGPAEADWIEQWWPHSGRPGERVEVGLPRDRALAELGARVHSGVVVAIDYGHLRGRRPRGGTLAGYRRGRTVPPAPDGTCDLTAHVAVDSLPHDTLTQQREALTRLGLARANPTYELARADADAYLAALQHNSALSELRGDPLGGFWWVEKAIASPR